MTEFEKKYKGGMLLGFRHDTTIKSSTQFCFYASEVWVDLSCENGALQNRSRVSNKLTIDQVKQLKKALDSYLDDYENNN